MGFWDTHKVETGNTFLRRADKDRLVANRTVFDIIGVEFLPDYEHGPQYVLTVELPDEATGETEVKKIGFAKGSGVPGRDKILGKMIDDHFGLGNAEPLPARITKGGNAYLIEPGV